jgi:putative heme-binding domain-containing protein
VIKAGVAYEREFERYLARLFMEQHPSEVAEFLNSREATQFAIENRMVAALALAPKDSTLKVAGMSLQLKRPPNAEELLRLAQFAGDRQVAAALRQLLAGPHADAVLENLLNIRNRFDAAPVRPALAGVAKQLWGQRKSRALAMRLASGFKLVELQTEIRDLVGTGADTEKIAAMRALREIGFSDTQFLKGTFQTSTNRALREETLLALTSVGSEQSGETFIQLLPDVNYLQRRNGLERLAGNKSGARAIVSAVNSGTLREDDIPPQLLDKLSTVLGRDAELEKVIGKFAAFSKPLLRLNGKDDAWLDSNITFDGPFTVETWVKLDPGIDNNDGILGAPGVLDLNFFGGHFRAWVGGMGDVVIAKKPVVADAWTHLALTRDDQGTWRIYLNGELDNSASAKTPDKFEHLRIGWTAPGNGTAGWLTEYRVWNRARTAEEIRGSFDRAFEAQDSGLKSYFSGTNWPKQVDSARVVKSGSFPVLLSAAEAKAQSEKFEKFRSIATAKGDSTHGQALFSALCMTCHSVHGQGAQIGPVLNGAGAMGPEALLRAVLTPNAAMEAGYRTYRVELKNGELVEGLFVRQDADSIVLRRPNSEDLRIAQDDVRRADFLRVSLMPEGLVDSLSANDATDLFSYLNTLK